MKRSEVSQGRKKGRGWNLRLSIHYLTSCTKSSRSLEIHLIILDIHSLISYNQASKGSKRHLLICTAGASCMLRSNLQTWDLIYQDPKLPLQVRPNQTYQISSLNTLLALRAKVIWILNYLRQDWRILLSKVLDFQISLLKNTWYYNKRSTLPNPW